MKHKRKKSLVVNPPPVVAASDDGLTEWRCRFCRVWNKIAHRYCKVCIARKSYATEEER